jgi:predicted Zn finger-like uncharacterized protein
MNVTCPECSTVYRVDPRKVPPGGVRARCSSCNGVIAVPDAQSLMGGATAPTSAGPSGVRPTPASPAPAVGKPWTPPQPLTQPWAGGPAPTPAQPYPAPAPVGERPRVATPDRPAPRATPAAPSAAAPAPPSGAYRTPGAATRAANTPQSADLVATPSQTQPFPSTRSTINPFLAKDPNLRAKRLARALISDIVTYYPSKHAEGVREGTLKELFKEEIRKSYEEYIAQVGREMAENTTHFQDALNDVLAGGQRLF